MFNVEYEDGVYEVYVRLRPHFRAFLERVSEMFEVRLLAVALACEGALAMPSGGTMQRGHGSPNTPAACKGVWQKPGRTV